MSNPEYMADSTDSHPIPRGTLLLTEKPFVYALKSQFREQRCDFCFTEGSSHLKCSECRYVYYCDRSCQRDAWSLHKFECKCLQNVAPRVVPDCARMLARLIMTLKRGGDQVKGYYTDRLFRRWPDLMTHYSDIKMDTNRREHVESLTVVLRQLLGENLLPNDVELLQLYGRMLVNAFNILDQDLNSIGTGIYLGVSITDHSCTPNAVVTFDGITLQMRSIEPMQCIDFSRIFISYVDLMDTRKVRQAALQKTYYFLCQCARCVDDKEDIDMNAAACPNLKCTEALDFRPSLTPLTMCPSCRTTILPEHVQRFHEIVAVSKDRIGDMHGVAYFDVCTVLLKKHVGVLHLLNVYHVKVLDLAFESAINIEKWSDALEFGLRLVPGLRKYNGQFSPLLAVLLMKLGKLLLFLDRFKDAKRYLLDAYKIMQFTHGMVAINRSQIKDLLGQADCGLMEINS